MPSNNIKRYVAKKDKNSAKALAKELEREFKAMALETEQDLAEVAVGAQRRMLVTAPRGESGNRSPASKKYGPLAPSIDVNQGRDSRGYYIDVSVGPFYSSFQEYGTLHQPPRPFFRPAIASAVAKFQSNKK